MTQEMGLSPVSVLECCVGFIGLSCLEPPDPLVVQGSLMAAGSTLQAPSPAPQSPLLVPAVTLRWAAQPSCSRGCLAARQSAASAAT